MRDFLYSETAMMHGLVNAPTDKTLALRAGRRLCEELLEPIQSHFGRIAIRSAYRSPEVNAFGNARQSDGKTGYGCASNPRNAARHIWDELDADGLFGATACIVVPGFYDRFNAPGDWQKLTWWVHDHLPYSEMEFFPLCWAFNINWHQRPQRRITSRAAPRGILTTPGDQNQSGQHHAEWAGIV